MQAGHFLWQVSEADYFDDYSNIILAPRQEGYFREITVRMAYILPPDFYQEKDMLYYGGVETSPVSGDRAWTKIELKE